MTARLHSLLAQYRLGVNEVMRFSSGRSVSSREQFFLGRMSMLWTPDTTRIRLVEGESDER